MSNPQNMCVANRAALFACMDNMDINYEQSFSCPICSELPHESTVIIMDGKEMGILSRTAKACVPPSAPADSAQVPIPL